MVSEMMPTCKWCNKPLTAGFALLCPECKERMMHTEQTAAKVATDHTARWDWLAPVPVETQTTRGHLPCDTCHHPMDGTIPEEQTTCPNCIAAEVQYRKDKLKDKVTGRDLPEPRLLPSEQVPARNKVNKHRHG